MVKCDHYTMQIGGGGGGGSSSSISSRRLMYVYIKPCFGLGYYTEHVLYQLIQKPSQTADRPFILYIPSPRKGRALTVQHSNSILNSLCQCLDDGIW